MDKLQLITADGDVMVGYNLKRSPDCKKRADDEMQSVDNAVFVAGAAFMYNAVRLSCNLPFTCIKVTQCIS